VVLKWIINNKEEMNSQQRKFLIEKIQENIKKQISSLKESKLEYPSASNYFFKAILEGKLQLQPDDVTLESLKQKALKSGEGRNWLSEDNMGFEKFSTVKLKISDLFIYPLEYEIKLKEVKEFNSNIDIQIENLKIQLGTIELRIQLASDKVLQKLINEVDDMGDIKLIETNLKLLN
jgi:hypothetical protein